MFTVPLSTKLTQEQIQGMLDKYLAAVEAFPTTIGVPAPLPEHEIINSILASGETWEMEPPPPAPLPPPTFAQTQDAAKIQIDFAAGQARLKYITEVPGQQATYLEKAKQADAYQTAGYAGSVPPFISAEAAATEQSARVVTDTIIATRDYWIDILAPQIEAARIGGKLRVTNTATADELNATLEKTLAALDSI